MDTRSPTAKIVTITTLLALVGCKPAPEETGAAGATNRPEVGVITLHPQAVAITAELPGRIVASLVAEVRPQVAGIIQHLLFTEGGEVARGAPLYQIDSAPLSGSL